MRRLSLCFLSLIFLFSSLNSHAYNLDSPSENSHLFIKAPLSPKSEAVISVTELAESSPSDVGRVLNDPQIKNADVLLSTDQEEVIKEAMTSLSKKNDKRLLRIIPIGKLAQAKDKISEGFKTYYTNAKRTLKHDRIGLTVLAVTVGTDTMVWIHSSSLEIHQKASMVIMNLVMAATFGLDRDLWTNLNRPIKKRLINVFDRFISTDKLNTLKTMTSQYVANVAVGFGVTLVRTGLLSLDHIQTALATTSFWTESLKVSAILSMTSFAWSELFSKANADTQPIAKTMLKRFAEMRGVILCQLATISMVMQPQIYGSMPIYSFIVHGSLGIIAMANADRIINWLENNKTIKKIYKKIQTFEKFIETGLGNFKKTANGLIVDPLIKDVDNAVQGAGIYTCRSLFAR